MNTAMALPGVHFTLAACALVFAGCSSQPSAPGTQGNALHLIDEFGHTGCGGDDDGACATGGSATGGSGGGGETDAGCTGTGTDAGVEADAEAEADADAEAGANVGDGGIPAAFRACGLDDDCVAVPLAGCCHNGWNTAINRAEVDAYDEAFACQNPRPICPMYIVNDTRVAECDRASQLCEMVRIDQIACGGFIAHPHQCPDGYQCVFGRIPDVPGHCVAVNE